MPTGKIKTPASLKKLIAGQRKKGKKIAFTNGCFDILHPGHVAYLENAKKKADILIAALNTDSSVRRLKGYPRPICSLRDRQRVLSGLGCIDYVTSFSEDTPAEIIGYLKPDIIIKGADYKTRDIAGGDIVRKYGGKVMRIKYIKGYSASALVKRIVKLYGI
jgi:rfaE bifunctional protein nucleotidyltransferase chain/domain